MHATANGRLSFWTWIAQLRSMSETDAPPKTRRSGSPAASFNVPNWRCAAPLKRSVDLPIQSSATPLPQPRAGVGSVSSAGAVCFLGPPHASSLHAASLCAALSRYAAPSPPPAFGQRSSVSSTTSCARWSHPNDGNWT